MVGPAMYGKSVLIKTLHDSYNELHENNPKVYAGSETTILNPKSISL